jgi:hypothetical protein
MKQKMLFSAVALILSLIAFSVSWAQCPEDPSDLGICDTFYVEPWAHTDTCFDGDCSKPGHQINNPGSLFPCWLYISLFVTHDSNTIPSGPYQGVQDSISTFVVPLNFWHDREDAGTEVIFPTGRVRPDSFPLRKWNNTRMDQGASQDRFYYSIFRHIVDEHGDTIHNRFAQMDDDGWTDWTCNQDIDTLSGVPDSGYVFTILNPMSGTCERWWEGSRVLLATYTFKVSDSMHVSLDSTFWPPSGHLTFVRYDAPIYVPRHNLPLTIWVGPPRIEVTSPNGGEVWFVGETHNITWFSEDFTGPNVKLEFSTDAGVNWMPIMNSTPNDGVHPWLIPDTLSTQCRVRVSDEADGIPFDISDSNFTITREPDFTIEAIPDTQWIKQGDSTSFEVILTSLYGFNSPCTLTVAGLPSLASGRFDPAVVIPTDTSILTISTDSLTPLGVYPLTITGTQKTRQIQHSIQKWLGVVSALNFKPDISVPESILTYAGLTVNFPVIATDPDTLDTLTVTKQGVGEFHCPPRTSPNVCYFWWSTENADTLNSPYQVMFVVNDGRDSTDTGIVKITVLPYNIHPSGTEGDANGDSVVNINDVVFLLNYLFGYGPAPNPPAAGDVNGDCFIGVSDIIWLLNYLFKYGPPPQIRCLPGDVNYDGSVNLLDVVYFIDYLLFNGPIPVSMRSTDVNTDCFINVVDLIYEVNYLLRGGPAPQPGCVAPMPGSEKAPSPAIAEVKFSDQGYDQKSRVMELPVSADFDVPVAGVALTISWDPEVLSFLQPILTPRTEGMGLYYNLKRGELTLGMLDIKGAFVIQPGTGPIVTLRFVPEDRKKFDLKSIKIEKATFVNAQAQELLLKMEK